MRLKIAVISDIHYFEGEREGRGSGHIGDILLRRAVERLNRSVRPDVTLLAGDLLDCGEAPGAKRLRRRLREITDLLESRTVIIPGNHDGCVEDFYADLPRPRRFVDIGGYRIVSFFDPQEPGFNARREVGDLELMKAALNGFDGPVIMLQHTSLFPPGACDCPYNYTNIDEIIGIAETGGITLSISGHFHDGAGLLHCKSGDFIICPALCEEPFAFLEIDLNGADVSVVRHELRIPYDLELVDYHVHTPFAYCSRGMDFTKSIELARLFGLAGLVFAEHSGQLYFTSDDYWSRRFLDIGPGRIPAKDSRMDEYIERARRFSPPAGVGLEADNGYDGRVFVRGEDSRRVDLLLGAPHTVSELLKPAPDPETAGDQFLAVVEELSKSGIHILAHPFRVFRKAGLPVPARLFESAARILGKYDVAAEINFHTNEPHVEFVSACIRAGVKLAFGSDSHELYEVGDFYHHLRLLEECGYDGDIKDILVKGDGMAGRLHVGA